MRECVRTSEVMTPNSVKQWTRYLAASSSKTRSARLVFNTAFAFLLYGGLASAQVDTNMCLFDEFSRQRRRYVNAAERVIRSAENQRAKAASQHIKVIPVVVHVIHNGGTSNISDAQIQSQLTVLNEDYRKIPASNGDGTGVDTEIEFCLARRDPAGRCTNGIVRISSPLSNHQTYQRSALSQLSAWDSNRYLNIYVVRNINNGAGALGYASFPGGPPGEDGVVVRHDRFGKIGTAAGTLGRTTTHELGHWFGLYHTFNNGCGGDTCSGGDFVCDTPPVAMPNYGCPVINSCTLEVPDVNDQVQNYLDYSSDNCKNKFTQGQKQRMHSTLTALRPDVWAQWNLDSTGCQSGYVSGPCKVIADFVTLTPSVCVGNAVAFYNRSQNSATSFKWYFENGSPATATVENPVVTYSATGTLSVKLVVQNTNGADSLTKLSYILVSTPVPGQLPPYFEGFESSAFPPAGLKIENPDGGITWERDTVAVPFHGGGCVRISNLINVNYGQSDALVLPTFDLTGPPGTPFLSFKWAYTKSDPSYSDELLVLVSKDCGANWIQVFYQTQAGLATAPTQTTPYIPTAQTDWKTASINLHTYIGQANVMVKIVNVTDGGNNLYIDNINLDFLETKTDVLSLSSLVKLSVYPNPSAGKISLDGVCNEPEIYHISVRDHLGRTLYDYTRFLIVGEFNIQLDLDVADGLYLIQIARRGVVEKTLKFVFKR